MSGDLDLVAVPAVRFSMGSSSEEVERCVRFWIARLVEPRYRAAFRAWIEKEFPRHVVGVDAFHIARFPVTNGQYREFLAASRRAPPESVVAGAPGDHPVWGVSFGDASAYAAWMSGRSGRRCRLPTEAEWECAARGPSRNEYPYGNTFDPRRGNTIESGVGGTTRVDAHPEGASEYGVQDLAGNVEEWTSTFYAPYPGGRRVDDDLTRTLGPRYRVLRGGSFALGGDLSRCARRHGPHPDVPFRFRGFRLVVGGGRA